MLVLEHMAILWILGIGAVIVVWMAANLSKTPSQTNKHFSFHAKPHQTPVWRKEISETYSTDEFDYLRKLERHQKDPQHWSCPFPPQG